jgi:2-keto-4-pentenoate hydratase/2-oxohepta-3-ene-1,7-dioic acid hydratase in catechol pathway
MKLGRVLQETPMGAVGRIVSVLPEEGRVVDLGRAEMLRRQARGASEAAARRLADAVFPSSMAAAIASGDAFLEIAHEASATKADDASYDIDKMKWLPAVDPPVVRDGLTFKKHFLQFHERVGRTPDESILEIPGYFKGTPFTAVGHKAVIPKPFYTEYLDYELELGFVVGRICHNATPEEGQRALFGLTIFNDFSARDVQKLELAIGMGPGKGKDFAYGIGPWITTIDEFSALDNLSMAARINGHEISRGVSGEVIWSAGELVAYMSIGEFVQPGDVIGSGTVGNGSGLENNRKLEVGDILELEVSGIGTLQTQIGEAEPKRWWPERRKEFW